MHVEYQRIADMPADVPIIVDEDPDGDVTIFLRADLITPDGADLLNMVVNDLCAERQLQPRMRRRAS